MNPKSIAKIRDEVSAAKSAGGDRPRYSEKVKKSVLEILRSGIRPSEVARLTGLNVPIIIKWGQRYRNEFRTVKVKKEFSPICAVTPSGLRIESLSIEQLKQLLEIIK